MPPASCGICVGCLFSRSLPVLVFLETTKASHRCIISELFSAFVHALAVPLPRRCAAGRLPHIAACVALLRSGIISFACLQEYFYRASYINIQNNNRKGQAFQLYRCVCYTLRSFPTLLGFPISSLMNRSKLSPSLLAL